MRQTLFLPVYLGEIQPGLTQKVNLVEFLRSFFRHTFTNILNLGVFFIISFYSMFLGPSNKKL